MKKQEKELFWELCRFQNINQERLKALLPHYATPAVLGHLFFNRMQGVACGVLEEAELLDSVNREFRNALISARQQNKEKNQSFFACLDLLSRLLEQHHGKYVMLKGAWLCPKYPAGYRTSNDIDLLVLPEHVTEIGNTLRAAGFRQGHLKNGTFCEASRKEIISSRMLRGETVPFFLKVDLPHLPYLEVDLNFSLDYKNSAPDTVAEILKNAENVTVGTMSLPLPAPVDFFVHLCQHLYKEATTVPWIRMKRDMTLYKFCDIYTMLHENEGWNADVLFDRAKKLGLADVCACVILWTDALLGIKHESLVKAAKCQLQERESLLHRIYDPQKGAIYEYTERDLSRRFFQSDRFAIKREVTEDV